MEIVQIEGLPEVINSIGIYFNVTPHVDRDTTYSGSGVKMIIYNGNAIPIQWYFKGQKGYATVIQNTAYVILPAQDATLSYRCLIVYKPFTNTIVERHTGFAATPDDIELYEDEILLNKFILPPTGSAIVVTPPATLYEPVITSGISSQYWRGDKTWQALNKSAVGLGSVDNTADSAKNVLSATKLTTARNINGVSFDGTGNITVADSTKEVAFSAGTTAQYFRGDKTWQALTKSAVGLGSVDNTADSAKNVLSATKLTTARTINGTSFDGTADITISTGVSTWTDFLVYISTTPASTSTLNRSGSYDFTTILKIGYGIKYKIGSTYYYGIVTAVTSTLLTVAGISLSSTIVEIYYCDQRNTMIQDIEINDLDWAAAATDILVSGLTKHPLRAPSGYLVLIEVWSATVDTGATKSKIKIMNSTNAVSSVSDGIECTTAATYNTSLVTIQSAYYYYEGMSNVRVDISQPGTNKTTTFAKVKLYWILN